MLPGEETLNAMTVDVEDYFHVSALAGSIARDRWDSMEYRAEASTGRLLELFADRGMHATFFVLGWVAERSPGLVRRIAAAGHEVACHGQSHELVYRQAPAVFREETLRSKACLEDLIGSPVRGYRAASYSITRESLWALDVILDAGFAYDSSVFPIRHDVYGLPEAPLRPARITAPSGRTLVEFPLSVAEVLGLRLPVAGGGYFRLLPYAVTRAGLRHVNRSARSPFVFYLHPWEVDPDQPRIAAPLKSRFRHYTNLDVCETRLVRLLSEFRFGRMDRVLADLGLLGAN
jgi:polysaccharide deacetylase family protein (PEP-CTERM system associated)